MKKWMPYVGIVSIFGLMFWMFGCSTTCSTTEPVEAQDAPVQEMAQPLPEVPAQAEAPVEEVVPDVVPEVIEPEAAPAEEGTGDEPVAPVQSE